MGSGILDDTSLVFVTLPGTGMCCNIFMKIKISLYLVLYVSNQVNLLVCNIQIFAYLHVTSLFLCNIPKIIMANFVWLWLL